MPRSTELKASARAQWLAQLAEALDQALRLTLLLASCRPESDEALVLRIRLLAIRAEVDSIRRGSSRPTEGLEQVRLDS